MKKKIRLLLSAALLSCFLSPLSFAADDTSSGTGSSSSSDTSVTLPSSYTKDGETYTLSGSNGLVGVYKTDSSSPSSHYLVITYQSDGKTVDSVVSHPVTDNYSILPSSVISGGTGNVITGNHSVISGGYSNEVISDNSVISGGNAGKIGSDFSVIIGGMSDYAYGYQSTIVGGNSLNIVGSGNFSTLVGGSSNHSQNSYGTLVGGSNNVFSGGNEAMYATVVGGNANYIQNEYGTIVGGLGNQSQASFAVTISGSSNNNNSGQFGTIVNGNNNSILDGTSSYSSIFNGAYNSIGNDKGDFASIFNGENNRIDSSSLFSSIFGGSSNSLNGSYNSIYGGQKNYILNLSGDSSKDISYSSIFSGSNNSIHNSNSLIINGNNNYIGNSSDQPALTDSVIINGQSSMIAGSNDLVLGGHSIIYSDNTVSVGGSSDNVNVVSKNSSSSIVLGGNSNISENSPYTIAIGDHNTVSEKADHSILIGNDNQSLVSKGMAIGNEAVASESGTIAFGHLSTDISHYDTVYDDLTDADKTSLTNALNDVYKASSTDYAGLLTALKKYHTSYTSADAIKTDIAAASSFDDWVSKTVSVTKETTSKQVPVAYGSDGLSRLVKVADGNDAHDAVTVEQLNNAVTDNTYKAGDGILIADDKTISLNHFLSTNLGNITTDSDSTGKVTAGAFGKGAYVLGGSFVTSHSDNITGGAGGDYSLVLGGQNNLAAGDNSVVLGGSTNQAGNYATVTGGVVNRAFGDWSSVSGGDNNFASGKYSSILGGVSNVSSGDYSSVSGGISNKAIGMYSSISGGDNNQATGIYSSMSGGINNIASGDYSNVVGGFSNRAVGNESSVSGGSNNVALDLESSILGGAFNYTDGVSDTISGGYNNFTSGMGNSISGGEYNHVVGSYSLISGGFHNFIVGSHASSLGGQYSSVLSDYSTGIAGGSTGSSATNSLAAGYKSLVSVENGTAIGYQATTNKDGTIAFGHDSGDVSGYTVTWQQRTDKDFDGNIVKNPDGTTNDYTQRPTITETTYDSAYYNRLVKIADGVDAHDAVTMEQLNKAVSDNTYKSGDGIKIADDKTISLEHLLGTDNFDLDAAHKYYKDVSYTYNASGKNSFVIGGQISDKYPFDNLTGANTFGSTGDYSVTVGGANLLASGEGSVVISGSDNKATGINSVVIGGVSSIVSGRESIALGSDLESAGNKSIVIGTSGANNYGDESIIVSASGGVISGDSDNSLALTGSTTYSSNDSINAGSGGMISRGDYSSIWGGDLNTIGPAAFEFSNRPIDGSTNSFYDKQKNLGVIGFFSLDGPFSSHNIEDGSTVVGGSMNHAFSDYGSAFGGEGNVVTGSFSASLGGYYNYVSGFNSVSLGGWGAKVYGSNSVTIGSAVSLADYSIAIGEGAVNNGASAGKSLAIGYQAVSHDDNTVSFGHKKGDISDISFSNTTITDSSKISEIKSSIISGLSIFAHQDTLSSLDEFSKKKTLDQALSNLSIKLSTYGIDYRPDKILSAINDTSVSSVSPVYTDASIAAFADKVAPTAMTLDKNTETYTSDVYNRLVNIADGIDDHDAATVAQVKKAITNGGINYTGGSHISVTSDAVIDTKNVLAYDSDDNDVATLAGKTGTKVANVKGGAVSASSMEAINGSQLYITNQAISGFAKDIQANTSKLSEISTSVSNANNSAMTAISLANDLDSSKADTSLSNLSDSGKSVIASAAAEAVQNYFKNVNTVTTSSVVKKSMAVRMPSRLPAAGNALSSDSVSQADLDKKADITYVDSKFDTKADKTTVAKEFDTLHNTLSSKADISYVDAGLSKKADQSFVEEHLALKADKEYVNSSLKDMGAKIDLKASSDASNIDVDKFTQKLDTGAVEAQNKGLVSGSKVYDAVKNKADKDYVDAVALGLNQEIAGTAQGLHNEIQQVGNKLNKDINRAAAGSNALAALHPMEYDPDDKFNFAAGYGHYRGANATAIGAYYYPNANTMISVGTTVGNGSPSVNAGISVKLGKGSAYNGVSKAELVKTVSYQERRIEAQDEKMKKQDERIAQLEEMVQKLLKK